MVALARALQLKTMIALWSVLMLTASMAVADGRFVVHERQIIDTQAANQPFMMFGVTYFFPDTGWAPRFWENYDPVRVRSDFALISRMGLNTVRVFLTHVNFFRAPCDINQDSVAKLQNLLDAAQEAGLVVQMVGPEHWGGLVPWSTRDVVGSRPALDALNCLWRDLSQRFGSHPALIAFELKNEPSVGWDDPALLMRWSGWLQGHYGAPADIRQALGESLTDSQPWDRPPGPAPAELARLRSFQQFREELATEWTASQVETIKAGAPKALVTIGFHQYSVPVGLSRPASYSGFDPRQLAHLLDFVSIHFYPIYKGFYAYSDAPSERRNLGYAGQILYELRSLPVPVSMGEFSWFGGGQIVVKGQLYSASEEDQLRWSRSLVLASSGRLSGWLNWPLYDDPSARDASQRSGLLTSDGRVKAWGQWFSDFAKRRGAVVKTKEVPPLFRAINWSDCKLEPLAKDCNQFVEK